MLLGLALGAVYATGFASTGGTDGAELEAAPNSNTPAENQDASELANKITEVEEDLTYNWGGRWGTIEDAVMYEIDLSSFGAGEKFFSEVLLVNTPAGFSDLQLQLRIAKIDKEAECGTAALESGLAGGGNVTSNKRVMIFDTDDAQVTFSGMEGSEEAGLLGQARYCVGIVNYSGSGKDESGTFVRKSKPGNDVTGIVHPEFVGTLNRMKGS